jgi:hypothetical protein
MDTSELLNVKLRISGHQCADRTLELFFWKI